MEQGLKVLLALMVVVASPLAWPASTRAVIQTNHGVFTIRLFTAEAPQTVRHFIGLVKQGKYRRAQFYRVVRQQYIQGGIGYELARKEKSITREASPRRKHVRGTVGFAWEDLRNPDSGTTEIYICVSDQFVLDEMGFTAFGRVVEGLDVLDEIANVPIAENWKYLTPEGLRPNQMEGSVNVPWHIPLQPVVIEAIRVE